MIFPKELQKAAAGLLTVCRRQGLRIGLAESCTGGLISACLTEIPGASDVVELGYVVYSNAAKAALLGVPKKVLADHGAVSAEVAEALVSGLLAGHGTVDLALSVTGIAGPGGATAGKPVGLVYLGVARRGREPEVVRRVFSGDRASVRTASAAAALELLRRHAEATAGG